MKKLRRLSTVLLAALLTAIMMPLVASADTTPIIDKVELQIDPLVVGTEVTASNLYDQDPKPQVTIINGECDIGPIKTGDGSEMGPFWTTNMTDVFRGTVVCILRCSTAVDALSTVVVHCERPVNKYYSMMILT